MKSVSLMICKGYWLFVFVTFLLLQQGLSTDPVIDSLDQLQSQEPNKNKQLWYEIAKLERYKLIDLVAARKLQKELMGQVVVREDPVALSKILKLGIDIYFLSYSRDSLTSQLDQYWAYTEQYSFPLQDQIAVKRMEIEIKDPFLEPDSTINELIELIGIAKENKFFEEYTTLVTTLSRKYNVLDFPLKNNKLLLEAYDFIEKYKVTKSDDLILQNLQEFYYKYGIRELSVKYGLEAERRILKKGNHIGLIRVYFFLVQAYLDLEDSKLVDKYLKLYYKVALDYDSDQKAKCLYGDLLLRYHMLKDTIPENILQNLEHCGLFDQFVFKYHYLQISYTLALAHKKQGYPQKAFDLMKSKTHLLENEKSEFGLKYLNEIIQLAHQLGVEETELSYLRLLRSNFLNSFLTNYREPILTYNMEREIRQQEVKEKQIELEQLRYKANQRFILSGLIFLLLLTLLFLLYFLFKYSTQNKELKQINISRNEKNRKLVSIHRLLEAKNRELESFVNISSHDLKEPVRTIVSFSDLCLRIADTGNQKLVKYLGYISKSGRSMNDLISQIYDYKQVRDQSQVELVHIRSILEGIINDHSALIKETNTKIKLLFEEDFLIYTNRVLLRQVFQNLISNAIKYSSRNQDPYITIDAEVTDSAMHFYLSDNGIGVSKDEVNKIFQPYYQVDNGSKGIGLGLTICAENISELNGAIEVVSSSEEGTIFKITLPINKVDRISNVAVSMDEFS